MALPRPVMVAMASMFICFLFLLFLNSEGDVLRIEFCKKPTPEEKNMTPIASSISTEHCPTPTPCPPIAPCQRCFACPPVEPCPYCPTNNTKCPECPRPPPQLPCPECPECPELPSPPPPLPQSQPQPQEQPQPQPRQAPQPPQLQIQTQTHSQNEVPQPSPRPASWTPFYDGSKTEKGVIIRSHPREPKKIWLDLGLNIGDTMEHFNSKFPDHKEWVKIGFEPSPVHFPTLAKLCQRESLDFTYYRAAVATSNKNITFYYDFRQRNQVGASILAAHPDTLGGKEPVEVASVDFSGWLKANVIPEDRVKVKLDVEGAEYDIVRRMFVDGTLCLIDEFNFEGHQYVAPVGLGGEWLQLVKYVMEDEKCNGKVGDWLDIETTSKQLLK